MPKCPDCKNPVKKTFKTWHYGPFDVEAYRCGSCGTEFREYTRNGKHSFMLKHSKSKSPNEKNQYVKI